MNRRVLVSLVIFALMVAFFSLAAPAQAAGSASFIFYCDHLTVNLTTDAPAVQADVIVRLTGIPGVTRAGSGLIVMPGSGTRSITVEVPINPILVNPPPSIADPDNQEQYIFVTERDLSGTIIGVLVAESVVCGGAAAFRGPGLPANRDLVLIIGDIGVQSAPDGDPTGKVIYKCQTVFLIDNNTTGDWVQVFMMGGWIPKAATVDVAENYGQPGGQPIDPACQ